MLTPSHLGLLDALRAWSKQIEAGIAVTASARQCRIGPSGGRRWITLDDLSRNTAHSLERASRDLWGRRSVRRGVRLLYAGTLEGGERLDDKRMHAHLIVGGLPPTVAFSTIEQAIAFRWQSSRWGYDDINIQWLASPADVDRWVSYFLKDITKETIDRWITNVPYHPK